MGTPFALFQTRIAGGPILAPGPVRHQYAVAKDGKRFLINVGIAEAVSLPINVVFGWTP